MGTRSTIALEFADGTVGQVYCHWDGYLEHNGKILQSYYTDPFKLRELIDLGDMSSLDNEVVIPEGQAHSFQVPLKGITTFYGRDRGETGVDAKYFKNFEDYRARHQYEEYEYILRTDGRWYVADHCDTYVPLAEALIAEAVA